MEQLEAPGGRAERRRARSRARRRRLGVVAVLVVAVALVATVFIVAGGSDDEVSSAPRSESSQPTTTPPTTTPPTTTPPTTTPPTTTPPTTTPPTTTPPTTTPPTTTPPTTTPPTTTPATPRAELRLGSRGSDVVALQQRLIALGYNPGPADGNFGTATAAAVIAFQKAKELLADGVVGTKTWEALNAAQ